MMGQRGDAAHPPCARANPDPAFRQRDLSTGRGRRDSLALEEHDRASGGETVPGGIRKDRCRR
jgi:hypothetical protein